MFARLPALLLAAGVAALSALPAAADGPADNDPANVKPIPPKGSAIPDAVREEVKVGLAELQGLIKDIGKHDLLPDVLIYEKAVRWALEYDEVFDPAPPKDKKAPLPPPAGTVKKVLAAGLERAKAMKAGTTPWATQTGGVLRGYRSKIDGSVQPYWMIVPKDYDYAAKTKHRLDFWWHGRYEGTVEAGFMANSPGGGSGIIPAPGALILHPFGRFSNANKFAGEVDTFECLEHAKKHYRIDESRLVARGFSMGGAACWQYGAHFPTLWAACAPGAGFSETPEFLKVYQNEKLEPTWYEKKLWRMYNASDYAQNFFNLPTVAYSGEVDSQKQAADVMAREFKKVGLELTHIIGPKTGHSYEKAAKEEVNKLIDAFVEKGLPVRRSEMKFVTYTLRYNVCGPVAVTGLTKHWEPGTITMKADGGKYDITTKGVTAFSLTTTERDIVVTIDGKPALEMKGNSPDRPYTAQFLQPYGFDKWAVLGKNIETAYVKAPGLQGPIDDAFMDSFVMVKPTGKPLNDDVGKWVEKEMAHAVKHWRQQYRGDAPVKTDTEVTEADIANSNLVLWGDATSNAVLGKIANKLPMKWIKRKGTKDGKESVVTSLVLGEGEYPADTHMPVMIFPNPLNPKKYVVLNSGFTFREYDYLNNARQVSKLPDYAVIDITTPPTSRYPGKVVRAGFFGENWNLLADDGK